MKKTILVALIAVAMLFAFTACEQQIPNMLPDDVNYIAIEQTADAVEGQAFDPALFNVVVYSSNPNVGPTTVPGTGYVSLVGGGKTYKVGDKVQAEYAGVKASELNVSVAEVVDVKVEGFPESVVQGAAMLKTSTLTASVTLSNGSELELAADDYTIWYDVNAAVTAEDAEGTPVTAKVFFDLPTSGDPVLSKTVANLKVTRDTSNDPKAIEKDEVTKLAVEWTITGVDGKTRTADTAEITVYAGESVSYKLYGDIADNKTNRPLYELTSADYKLSLDTLSAVIGTSFGPDNITNVKVGETTVKAYTANVMFVSDDDAPNYGAGSVTGLTLKVTVKDNIVSVPAGGWMYDSNFDGTADEAPAATPFSLSGANNLKKITKKVTSVGGTEVTLVATEIKDRNSWTANEMVAGSTLTVDFKWGVESSQSSNFTVTGTDSVTIKVAAAQ